MANLKKSALALALALFLCLNALETSARAKPQLDEDDDFFKSSEENSDEHHDHAPHHHGQSRSLDGSSDDDGGVHILQSGVGGLGSGTGSEADGKSGFAGSNFVNFNETCKINGRNCNPYNNLYCTANNRCLCKIDPPHTYIRSQEKCHPIRDFGEKCEFDAQCREGKSKSNSRCPERVGTCQCYDAAMGGKREVVEYNGVCVIKRNHLEPCETDAECQSTMKDNSYCAPKDDRANPTWANATQICQCKRGYVWDSLFDECLKIADNGLASECRSYLQCTEYMGPLSKCSRENKKCECHDNTNPGEYNVVYYGKTHTCYQRAHWNTTCSIHEECKASLSSEAECLQSSDLTMQLICQCPRGKACKDDTKEPDGAMGFGANGVMMTVIASVVVMKQYFKI